MSLQCSKPNYRPAPNFSKINIIMAYRISYTTSTPSFYPEYPLPHHGSRYAEERRIHWYGWRFISFPTSFLSSAVYAVIIAAATVALEIRDHFQRTQRRQVIIDNANRKPQPSLSGSALSTLSCVSGVASEKSKPAYPGRFNFSLTSWAEEYTIEFYTEDETACNRGYSDLSE